MAKISSTKSGNKSTDPVLDKKKSVVEFRFDKSNLLPIAFSVFIAILLFGLQIKNYPHPEMFSDSGSYLTSAVRKILGYRPIGYSWVISFYHSISSNLHFLPVGQFLIHLAASIFLTQTILHFMPFSNRIVKILFHLMVIASPCAIQITNAVMSDSSFLSLTYIWFGSLLWIAFSVNLRTQLFFLALHGIVLYIVYMVRFIAMIYPLLSCILFFMTLSKWRSIGLTVGLFLVILIAIQKNNSLLKNTFGPNYPKSSFAGWLLGNNASAILGHTRLAITNGVDKDVRFVNEVMMQYPDSVFSTGASIQTEFIWSNALAGKEVVRSVMQRDNISYFHAWYKSGSMVGKWARWIIFQKPLDYIRYFLWPAGQLVFKIYPIYEPPLFKLDDDVQKWYSYPIKSYNHTSNYNTNILTPIVKILGWIQWIAFGISLFLFVKYKHYKLKVIGDRIGMFCFIFILIYFGFHVLASPLNNYRYHIPTFTPMWIIILYMSDVYLKKFYYKDAVV
ncbi:MAG: hypothetical protein ABI761_12710 [Saprospiraceae bacterium]